MKLKGVKLHVFVLLFGILLLTLAILMLNGVIGNMEDLTKSEALIFKVVFTGMSVLAIFTAIILLVLDFTGIYASFKKMSESDIRKRLADPEIDYIGAKVVKESEKIIIRIPNEYGYFSAMITSQIVEFIYYYADEHEKMLSYEDAKNLTSFGKVFNATELKMDTFFEYFIDFAKKYEVKVKEIFNKYGL